MDTTRSPGTPIYLGVLAALVLHFAVAPATAAPKTTQFTHSVGFSFDYPTKWNLKYLREGLMLIPHDVDKDPATGKPLELAVIGFVGVAGVTDPFDPSFPDAFEEKYRSLVPRTRRIAEIDWLETPMGTSLVVPFEDAMGNRHTLYCTVLGDLGIFLGHISQGVYRPQNAKMRQIFSSFSWTDSVIDPDLARSWTVAEDSDELIAGRWTFTENGRFRHAELTAGSERSGFYSSYDGVLNIVWDHGTEESYFYSVSRPHGRYSAARDPDVGRRGSALSLTGLAQGPPSTAVHRPRDR